MSVSTYKRCGCWAPVLDASGEPVIDASGLPKRRRLGNDCPKLRRRDGSWSPHHGAWYYATELPRTSDGKRRKLRRGPFDTQGAAEDAAAQVGRLLAIPDPGDTVALTELADLLEQSTKGGRPAPEEDEVRRRYRSGQPLTGQVTVADYLDSWLAGKVDLRPATRQSYESHIRLYLKPQLGKVALSKLRVAHLTQMREAIETDNARIATIRETGTKQERQAVRYRKVAGPSSIRRVFATLSTALEDARREHLVEVNVAKLVKLPAAKRPRGMVWTDERVLAFDDAYRQALADADDSASAFRIWRSLPRPSTVMVWTPAQTNVFLAHAAGDQLGLLFRLMATTGMRRGEAVGLRWTDMHLDKATATVAIQSVQVGWNVEDGPPKSDAGERMVALDETTVRLLHQWRRRQLEDRMAWGEAWADSGKVFTSENGQRLWPSTVSARFEQLAFDAGLPPIRLHDLRHGSATLALSAGVPMKTVQTMLGHSSISITADTYTSVSEQVQREAASAIAGLLSTTDASTKPRAPGADGTPST